MSTDGKVIFAFIQEIRKFCRQISELLGTADKLVGEEGWECCIGNRCSAHHKYSLIDPHGWFLGEAFRFYQHQEAPHLLAFIALMLDDHNQKHYFLNEPLIAAGWFDYGKENQVVWKKEYWYSRFHGYMENRKDDGTIHVVDPQKYWSKEENEKYDYKFRTAHTFAVPLVLVTDTDTLKSKITDPLIRELNKSIK